MVSILFLGEPALKTGECFWTSNLRKLLRISKGVFLNGNHPKGLKLCFAENLVGVRECLSILALSFNDLKSLMMEKLFYRSARNFSLLPTLLVQWNMARWCTKLSSCSFTHFFPLQWLMVGESPLPKTNRIGCLVSGIPGKCSNFGTHPHGWGTGMWILEE